MNTQANNNNIIKAGLICAAVTLTSVSLPSYGAGQLHFDNQCEVDLHGQISLRDHQLNLVTENDTEVLIDQNKALFINQQAVSLSAEQQAWVSKYYDDIQRAVPQAAEVAIEGIAIAKYASTEALKGLLGENSKTLSMIENKLSDIQTKLQAHLYANPESITFDTQQIEQEIGLNQQWDAQIDEIMQEVASSAMGEFFAMLAQNMMNGGGNMSDLETRMESLGDTLESKLESRAKAIEPKAKALCNTLINVNNSEQQLQSIKGLETLNVVTINKQA